MGDAGKRERGKRPLRWRAEREAAAGLWPIRRTLALASAFVVAGLVGLTVVALAVLGFPHLAPTKNLSVSDLLDVLKLVLASVAGLGALFALVMNYRKQRLAEMTEIRERARVFNERFATAAGQIGHDQPAIRLAGVYSMASLADDWHDGRQTCIDVLCAYLRMPYEPEPSLDVPVSERLEFRRNQEVRHTVIAVITAHLRDDARTSWQGYDLDFTGAVFDGGSFTHANFTGGTVDFTAAEFTGGTVDFSGAKFAGAMLDFTSAKFAGEKVDFSGAEFIGAILDLTSPRFVGGLVDFNGAEFVGGLVDFSRAKFVGGLVGFTSVKFAGEKVNFSGAEFAGAMVGFSWAKFTGEEVNFSGAEFIGGTVNFTATEFIGGAVDFLGAEFTGGTVGFDGAEFAGGLVGFHRAKFTGGEVDLRNVARWQVPPEFGPEVDAATPPAGLLLPPAAG